MFFQKSSLLLFVIIGFFSAGGMLLSDMAYAENGKIAALKGKSDSYIAYDRIVIKLHKKLDKSLFRRIDGKVTTGFPSLDLLNAKYDVKQITQLFPGSEESIQAYEIGLPRIYRVQFSESQNISQIIAAYENDPVIEIAQPVGIHKTVGINPNDPYFDRQWNMRQIQAPDAWQLTQGDSTVILAIIDTGVDWVHPDLAGSSPFSSGNIWMNWAEYAGLTGVDDDGNGYIDDIRGWDWVNVGNNSSPIPWPGEDAEDEDNNPMDFNGHGSHCAGIAAALTNNATGVAGLGWSCKIMPLRVGWSVNYQGYEVGLVSMDYCAQAIYYAARNGALAINCSWGSSNTGGIADAVSFATGMGVTIVCAAGNDDLSDASYLAARDDCISVAATGPSDKKADYSSYGFWVDVSAPGGDFPPIENKIYSTYYDHVTGIHGYEWLNGTSMAAPHVVGLVGLIRSQFPAFRWRDVKQRLQFTSDALDALNPGYQNGRLGEGRINAFKAISQTQIPEMSVIFSENFNNGLPASWNADAHWRDDDPGDRNAKFDDTYVEGTIMVGYDIWEPPFLIVDSDHAGNVDIDASLISPIIDCSVYSDIRLIFNNWFQNYYGGNVEKGDIDVRINAGPWQNVARFISNTENNIVDAGREVMIRLPASVNYQSDVQFRWRYYDANDEFFWGIDNVKLIGSGMTLDRQVSLIPAFQTSGGAAGDTLSYMKTVRNLGLLADSYDLVVSGNSWTTSLWDSAGNILLHNTGQLSSSEGLDFMIKVEIPEDAATGETDTVHIRATSTNDSVVFAEASIVTRVYPSPARIPWFDDFPTPVIEMTKWDTNNGPAEVNNLGLNEPSSPYSLNLNGDKTGGDEIQSYPIDLSDDSLVIFSYYYQRTGGGDSPETGDDLWVDYYNSSGSWINLKQYRGDGPDMSLYEFEEIALPAGAYHNYFRIRFHNLATPGNYDDWFIDDVSLTLPADIVVSLQPDPLDFTLNLGDSTTGTINIANAGPIPLRFQIRFISANTSIADSLFIDIPYVKPIIAGEAARAGNDFQNPAHIHHNIAGEQLLLDRKIDILLIYADKGATVLQTLLRGYPDIGLVDTCLARSNGGSIPTLSDLLSYDLVIAWNNNSWADKYAIGNVLADFIDVGGKVITLVDCWSADPFDSHGRYFDGEYSPFTALGGALFEARTLGWYNTSHPIMQHVASLSIARFYNNVELTQGAELVAEWDDTTPLVATKPNTVAINIYAGDGYNWTGDFPTLIHNSITYLFTDEINWLTVTPMSDTVAAYSGINVLAKVSSDGLIPDSTYSKNLMITSNDPEEKQISIPVSLTVNPVDYYFRLNPSFRSSPGIAGDTLVYRLTLINLGQQIDSYNLTLSGNSWITTFWDSTGKTPISNIGPLASEAKIDFMLKIEIPSNTKFGDADTARIRVTSIGDPELSHLATIQTTSVGTPVAIPWSDDFPTTTLNSVKWPYNRGPAEVNDTGLNEPSPPYALNLDGNSIEGDEVQSELIDLSKDSLVMMSYYYQRTGGGESPDIGDDLWIDYYTSSGNWLNLRRYPGLGPDTSDFALDEFMLPADAYHNCFRVRLRNVAIGGDEDDWFLDNISIARAPKLEVKTERYEVRTVTGDSVIAEPLLICNAGEGYLRYKIFSISSSDYATNLQFEPASRAYPTSYYSIDLEKGTVDPRKGIPITLNTGGPDNFGYFWVDSGEPDGPEFNWVDITTRGTLISGLGDDTNLGAFDIGFSFPFYGNEFTTFRFCSNGFISFTSSASERLNKPIPNQSVFNLIAPFWDDLIFDANSSAYYHYDGEKLIIQANNVKKFGTSMLNTFETFLYPDGSILFQYLTMQASSYSATIGIQNNDGTDGLEVAFNTDYIHDRLAVLIASQVFWIKFEKTTGTLPKDSTATIPVLFTAKDIRVDTVLVANIIISSNDPVSSKVVIPVQMTVSKNEFISGYIQAAGNPLAGANVQVWDEYPNGSVLDSDVTGTDGKYALNLPPTRNAYTVRAYATGYMPSFKQDVPGNSQNVNFTLSPVQSITSTTEWVNFFSSNTNFWGGPVQAGDIITAEDPDSVVCGMFTVHTSGHYGFMPVYGDDRTTPDVDEGAQAGNRIKFKINGFRAETKGPDSPVWNNHGSILHVDLNVDEIDTLKIPLSSGWNLVSWNLDTPEDSTKSILVSVISNVLIALAYEEQGLTYDPSLPQFSNLQVMDHLHGYWLKMTETDTLVIVGAIVDYEQTPIYCESGWNLVSYLPNEPDSVWHALTSVIDNTIQVTGYKNGGLIYDPDWPEFNTLQSLSPTYGYWIWLSAEDTLIYTQPLPGVHAPSDILTGSKLAIAANQNKHILTPTNAWVSVLGQAVKLNDKLLPPKTVIQAFDPRGVLCGTFTVTTPGTFGFMPIYRDDPLTEIDEGAEPGDEITICFDDFQLPMQVTWTNFGDVIDLSPLISSVGGELTSFPKTYQLSMNYPNPFNPETTIKYQLPKANYVSLKIYNLLGQHVRTLVAEEKQAGYYQINWNGKDNQGNSVSSGIYLYELKSSNFQRTRKMLILR